MARCTFSEAQTLKQNRASINIEGALAFGGSSTQYDWRNKPIVQLTPEDLSLVPALLNDKVNQVQFAGRAVAPDKMIEFHRQQTNIYIRMAQKDRSPVSVPVMPPQALNLTSLLFRQIQRNHPHLQAEQMRVMEDQLVRQSGDTSLSL